MAGVAMATADLSSNYDAAVKGDAQSKPTLTPPASEEAYKNGDSSSDLSEPEVDDDDIGDITPDHYWGGGRIPVFKPVSPHAPLAPCRQSRLARWHRTLPLTSFVSRQ